MKRLFDFKIVVAAIIAITGCNSNNDYLAVDERFSLESLQNGITTDYHQEGGDCPAIHTSLSPIFTYDLKEWSNKTAHIRQKMSEVITTNGNFYIYSTLKNVSITANGPVGERKAGEELVDLFDFFYPNYVFTYPDGDLVYKDGDRSDYAIDEWIEGSYMLPKYFTFVPKIEIPTDVSLNISLTLATETGNKIISNSFSFTAKAQ